MAGRKTATAAAPEQMIDGRRQRAEKSRAQIVEALLDFARDGVLEPSADAVAERAGVGRRTVFRHFNDMEELYREMHLAVVARIAAIRALPINGVTWRDRLAQLMDRRARLFEEILPIHVAAAAHRSRSEFLAREHVKTSAVLRHMLLFVLPKDVKKDGDLLEAMDSCLSIETWRRLRREQGLSAKASRRIVQRMIDALLAN